MRTWARVGLLMGESVLAALLTPCDSVIHSEHTCHAHITPAFLSLEIQTRMLAVDCLARVHKCSAHIVY